VLGIEVLKADGISGPNPTGKPAGFHPSWPQQ
jgi:hypothetical protein